MMDEPRQKLREIVAKYGARICENKQQCKGLILDYCSGYRKEANVLIAVLEENVPTELLNTSAQMPTELLITRLIQKVYDERALDKDATRWAVESWALALGIKVDRVSQTRPKPPQPTSTKSASTQPTQTSSLPKRVTSRPGQVISSSQLRRKARIHRMTSFSSTPNVPVPTTPLPIPVSSPIPNSQGTTQIYIPTKQPHTLRNLLLIAICIVIIMLGARTSISLHLSNGKFSYFLLPYTLYCIGAMLGHKRGLLASLLFLALGDIGLPLFLLGSHPLWSIPGFLNFYPGRGGIAGFGMLYYYVCPVIVFTVGWLCRRHNRKTFWQSLGIVLIGQIMYTAFTIGIYIVSLHLSLVQAFTVLHSFDPDALVLAFIVAIPVHWINVIHAKL